MQGPTASAPRRTGRPRRSARPSGDGDPRREIVAAATQLFSERGVGGTTMAEIARRCGLQQPSLYYYFRSKGQLLDEIVAEANRAPLELVQRVRDAGGSAAVQLYRIIRADVAALCALPYDLNEIHRLAARDREAFARYWQERDLLVEQLAAIVRSGVDAGELRTVDPRLTALTLMSNDEGTQNWLRVAGRDGAPVRAVNGEHHAVGAFLADLAVRGLLVAPRDLDRVRRAADASDAAAVVA
ncbi:MAG: TetR/AcrR family transcriptional regulator [Acidimicrobiia bacterium]